MSNVGKSAVGGTAHVYLRRNGAAAENISAPQGYVDVKCYGPDGELKWEDGGHNIVTNEGLDDLLTKYFKAGTGPTWYVVPIDVSTAPASTDDYANTMGTAQKEFTGYSQANRVEWVDGTVSSQSIDNTASVAQFSITGSATLYGAALVNNNTKGDTTDNPATHYMYSRVNFSGGSRAVQNGDTLEVTYTFTAADDAT